MRYLTPCWTRNKKRLLMEKWEDKLKNSREKKDEVKHLTFAVIKNQVLVNEELMEDDTDIAGELMEIVMQFGYICLFSPVFPLAGFVCYVANSLTLVSIF